ncbi:mechanosensitive ion channel family protein [Diaphorobacter aerolatus]|uniref:Small-conductance mechanosensitive channel n=1 Tax=Diaphorobacter aerolatus TaxID=1288495 RepID=A0A7H0GI76_9BURK|nr:mechanosensitive ion channel family protein [Diaphorobacter aerolatus]QNP47992.1 mechanosensitive ion channel family protein [Diaphorobacter aerolatus]
MPLRWRTYLPEWMQNSLELLIPGFQIVLIIAGAILLHSMFKRVMKRAGNHYQFPHELTMPVTVVVRWLILLSAVLLVLERLGVSASVLWTAFTGFATVGAVAFFAAWSVLSNLFCAFLIFVVGPFRVGDHIEVLDTAEKLGAVGKVVDINLLYTTLEDSTAPAPGTLLQIPNSLIFQRVVRRWPQGQSLPENKQHTAIQALGESPAAPRPATFP